ncbi:multidrug transporter [Pasteurellaceae bacterium LFhippo2]|nr:multidrug transporter [Pasteurellaceae bacterium LFhippo2]
MKKALKIILSLLGITTVVAGGLGYDIYRNIGDRPDSSKYAHLPYHQNGVFVADQELGYFPERRIGEIGRIGRSHNAPEQGLPVEKLQRSSFGAPEEFAYYWFGHSSAILEINQQRFLIDPVFNNAAPTSLPFVMQRYQDAPIDVKSLPEIDVVLITHDHYDHLEAPSMRYLADKAKRFVVPLGVGSRLLSWGVPADKITELGWEDSTQVGDVKLTAEKSLHYSSRWTNDRNSALWVSYAFESPTQRIYWSGDSGYGKHFAEIGKKYGHFDVAFIEMDAANPGWPNTHMFPEQAVQASIDVNATRFLPIHWGVFDLAGTKWNSSIISIEKEAKARNVRLDVPKIGQKYHPDTHQNENWWEGVR